MKPPIQLDKQYKTRDGREVRIHAIDGPDSNEPVVASILNGNKWCPYTWTIDGGNFHHRPSGADLIEVVPLWEGEVWVRANELRPHGYWCDDKAATAAGWRKIKVKQEEPT